MVLGSKLLCFWNYVFNRCGATLHTGKKWPKDNNQVYSQWIGLSISLNEIVEKLKVIHFK